MYETSVIFDHGFFRHHYLCHYRSIGAGADPLSRSLLKFKLGAQPDLDAWVDCARAALAEEPPMSGTILVRALGHRETSVLNGRPRPLDLLCQTLACDFGCRYLPTLLSKSRETPGNKGLSTRERATQLLDVYSADPPAPPCTPLLLIDDILTTGTTIHAITLALRRSCPGCPVRIFTLARAAGVSFLDQTIPLQGRSYRFDPVSGWQLADLPPSGEPMSSTNSV